MSGRSEGLVCGSHGDVCVCVRATENLAPHCTLRSEGVALRLDTQTFLEAQRVQ